MNIRDAINKIDWKPITGLPDCITKHPNFIPAPGLDGGQIGGVGFWLTEKRIDPDGHLYDIVDDDYGLAATEYKEMVKDPYYSDWPASLDELPIKRYVIVRGDLIDYARIEMDQIEQFANLILGGAA